MGMATSICLGTDSSWLKVEIAQIMLEQVRKYTFFCTPSVDMPPITACPWINGTMECMQSGSGKFGPRNCCENISLDKKYFYIIYSKSKSYLSLYSKAYPCKAFKCVFSYQEEIGCLTGFPLNQRYNGDLVGNLLLL